MSRLIDADKFFMRAYNTLSPAIMYGIAQLLDEQPPVDAVPVVHCKDCKKYAREEWKRKLDEPHNFADTEWKMEFSGCMGFDDPEKGYCYAGEKK